MKTYRIFKLVFVILLMTENYAYAEVIANFKLPSAKNLSYRVVANQTVFNNYKGVQLAEGRADSLGQFTAKLNIDKEKEVVLFIGDRYYKLWLGKNGLIDMFEEKGFLKFTGDYAKENEVLYLTKLMRPNLIPGYFAFAKNEAQAHVKMLDSLEKVRLSILKSNKNSLTTVFFEQAESETIYFSSYRKSQFAALNQLKTTDLPDAYFDFWNNFKVMPDGIIAKSYLASINDYAEFKIKQKFGHTPANRSKTINEQFSFLDSLLINNPSH